MTVDLLDKRAEAESELRGLREARARNISAGRDADSARIIELEALLSGIADAERIAVEKERKKRQQEAEAARAEMVAEVRDLYPQFEDALRSAQLAAHELVGALRRTTEIHDGIRERANLLVSERKRRRGLPLGRNDLETRLSGRLVAVLSLIAHPRSSFGNISWHPAGMFKSSDDWRGQEASLLKPHLKEFFDNASK